MHSHAGQIQRPLHCSEIRNIDRPRLLRSQTQAPNNLSIGTSRQDLRELRLTQGSQQTTLSMPPRPHPPTNAASEVLGNKSVEGRESGRVRVRRECEGEFQYQSSEI